MPGDNRRGQQLIALFCLGSLLFSFPVIAAFNHSTPVAGIPLLVFYLFGVWAALIALAAFLIERK